MSGYANVPDLLVPRTAPAVRTDGQEEDRDGSSRVEFRKAIIMYIAVLAAAAVKFAL